MINPAMLLSPADLGRSGVNTPAADTLNGAFTGQYMTVDPNAQQPAPSYLGATAIPSFSQGPTLAAPSFVSPTVFGVGGPVVIMGTPNSLGPGSALSGQSTAGDAGVMSGMGVGQLISPTDVSVAPSASADPGAAVAAAAAAAPAAAPA